MAQRQLAASVLQRLTSSLRQSSQALQPGHASARCIASSSASHYHLDISDEWYLRQRQEQVLGKRTPLVTVGCWVAPNAVLVGDVDLIDRVSVWYGCVLRGDLNNITIGPVTNIQDRTVIHAARTSPTGLTAATLIGKFVTVEPQCVLRSVRIEDQCIVGTKSVLLEGSMMETKSILAPGSVVPPARRIPTGELWGGNPARFVRKLTDEELEAFPNIAEDVRQVAWAHHAEHLPYGTGWRLVEEQRLADHKAGKYEWVNMRQRRYLERLAREKAAAQQLQPGTEGTAPVAASAAPAPAASQP